MAPRDTVDYPDYARRVNGLRHPLLRHRVLAGWLIAAALLMKLLVPTGYMIAATPGSLRIVLCSGTGPAPAAPMTAMMPGMAHHDGKTHGQAREMPCAFAALGAATLAAVDPLLLAAAVLFIVATVFRSADTPRTAAAPAFLRPPLRGPPARA